jgi:iron(III) transport system substrate-binding protein
MMVMIAHTNLPTAQRPAKWQDLMDPKFNRLVQMGSPLESGTTFAAVAYLSRKYGWNYFDQLRNNNIGSSGGNSAVIQKVESGEKKIGVVLLENALAAKKRGSPIDIIYPSDGGIPIPSVQFVLKGAHHAAEAERFSNFILSIEGQQLLRAGYMYPVNSKVPAPEGALPFEKVTENSTQWTPALIDQVSEHAKEIKRKFSDLVLE